MLVVSARRDMTFTETLDLLRSAIRKRSLQQELQAIRLNPAILRAIASANMASLVLKFMPYPLWDFHPHSNIRKKTRKRLLHREIFFQFFHYLGDSI